MAANSGQHEWPGILQRYVDEAGSARPEYQPRLVLRRFHGTDVTAWQGLVHYEDIDGYVENIRLKFFLNRWRTRRGDPGLRPTTDDIYDIMIEADDEEPADRQKPFHIARISDSIKRNGVQEPVVVSFDGNARGELWDGNRRFFGTLHIMKRPEYAEYRSQAKWLPALVISPTGSPEQDQKIKHSILTELNFVDKDHIPWPAYVKAEQIYLRYTKAMAADPNDPVLSRQAKEQLAKDYGLKGWRVADRWIKMYDLAAQFKEFEEEEHQRDSADADLKIQEKFEYFDEMSKPGVWGVLKNDPEAREQVFDWLWDGKFKAWPDVRMVPRILADPVARRQAMAPDVDSVKRAIETVIVNDPNRIKDKEAVNEKIAQFSGWLDSFKREDYRQLSSDTLQRLKEILNDVVRLLDGLLGSGEEQKGA